jgi:parvulin-like peptidyl-prolyl isomerase
MLLLQACSDDKGQAESLESATGNSVVAESNGAVARVGDQIITFNELNTMLNSSAMVGLSIPALGTPERNQVIMTLLDKVISANLLYLDAKEKGTDKLTAYASDIKKFEDAVLISMYRSKVLIGDIQVNDEEVQAYFDSSVSQDKDLNDDTKLAIEAIIRKKKFSSQKDSLRERLRAGTEININEDVLDASADNSRSPADIVATVGDQRITWNDVEMEMRGADHRASFAPFYVDNDDERLKRLQVFIDNLIMVNKANAAGMRNDPEFTKRTAEYRKTRLINIHRDVLIRDWKPSEDELKSYFVDNMDKISVPEARKVQMVVVETKEEAENIKAKIDNGEITIFQAARDYSIDPSAKRTLGEMGWVRQGTGFAGLDDFTFHLEPEVVGGPVESPAGWHLVKVLDVIDAQFQNFDEPRTRDLTLRNFIKDRFNDYVVDLRKNHFEVAVYNEELNKNFQKEADYIAQLSQQAQKQGSVTEQRQKQLQKWITTPPQQ